MKKNLKKILSSVLAASIVASAAVLPAGAEQLSSVAYEVDDNFENYISDGTNTVRNWTTLGDADITSETADAKHGTSVKILTHEGSSTAVDGISTTISSAVAESQYLDIDFDVNALSDADIPAVYFAQGESNIRIWFKYGKVYAGFNAVEGCHTGEYTYTPGQWFNVHIRINGYSNTYSVDIDGQNIVSNKVPSWGGGPGVGTASEFPLKSANTIGFVNMKKGASGCLYDNIGIKRIERKDYRPAQNFRTDFSELGGEWEIPDGFKSSSVYAQIGGGKVDDEHGQSLEIKGSRGVVGSNWQDVNVGSKLLLREKVSSGKIIFEFDSYNKCPDTDNVWSRIYLYYGDNLSGGDYIINDEGGVVKLVNDTSKNTSSVKNGWAKYKLIADVSNMTLDAYYNGEYLGQTALQSCFKNGITGIYFKNQSGEKYPIANGGAQDKIVYVDNLKITVEPSVMNYSFNDDFESYSTVEDALTVWSRGSATVNNKSAIVVDDTHGKAFYLGREGTESSKWINKEIPKITSGKVEVKTSVKLDGPGMTAIISFTNGDVNVPIVTFDSGKVAVALSDLRDITVKDSLDLGTCTDGVWYDVTAEVDMTNRIMNVTVTDTGNGASKSVTNVPFTENENGSKINEFSQLRLQQWSWSKPDTANGVYFDDVSITYLVGLPSVTADSISLVNYDGNIETNTSAAAPSVEQIKIDFGAPMNVESLLNNVSLINTTDNASVKFYGEISDNIYTLRLPDMLEPEKNYLLTIPAGTISASGNETETNVEFEFATREGEMKAEFEYLRTNALQVENKSDLTEGEAADTGIKYFNSTNTDKNMCIIFSYYKDNQLIGSNYRHIILGKDIKNVSLKYLETIGEAINEADTVRVFLWNGIDLLLPLDKNYVFD